MRPWRSATLMAAGIVALCLALTGCGSHQFGSAVTCSSETHCLVVLQSPAENGDPLTWSVTSSDARVRIVPAHGAIAPGQSVIVQVTLPPGAPRGPSPARPSALREKRQPGITSAIQLRVRPPRAIAPSARYRPQRALSPPARAIALSVRVRPPLAIAPSARVRPPLASPMCPPPRVRHPCGTACGARWSTAWRVCSRWAAASRPTCAPATIPSARSTWR